jgi:hypothetical protein
MNSLKIILFFCIALAISACDHPLEIKGQGDIMSLSGDRNCSLEEFQAGATNCSRNTVQGAYVETYTAQPRSGWVFNRWENYCTAAATNSCSFTIPADLVQKNYGATMPALVAVFTPEAGSNPFFLDQSTAQYSATRVIQSSEGTFTMKESVAPQKHRLELQAQGLLSIMILRSDLNASWLLYPSLKQYMKISSAQFSNQAGDDMEVIEYKRVGTEVHNNQVTGKYSVTIKNGRGFFWITDSGILLRMEMTITVDGKQQQFTMYLTNLLLGPQPGNLFEIPAGFTELVFNIPPVTGRWITR